MEYIFFVLVIVLLVGGRSAKFINAFRKELSDLENQPVKPVSVDESLFTAAKSTRKSFAQEEKSAGYFTYETEDSSLEKPNSEPKVSRIVPQAVRQEEQLPSFNFDLKQAIVYNAILTPKYLTGVDHYDN